MGMVAVSIITKSEVFNTLLCSVLGKSQMMDFWQMRMQLFSFQ